MRTERGRRDRGRSKNKQAKALLCREHAFRLLRACKPRLDHPRTLKKKSLDSSSRCSLFSMKVTLSITMGWLAKASPICGCVRWCSYFLDISTLFFWETVFFLLLSFCILLFERVCTLRLFSERAERVTYQTLTLISQSTNNYHFTRV